MENLKIWFKQVQNLVRTFKTYNNEFVIYKGFKITNRNGDYFIEDTRFSNMYGNVTKHDLDKFNKLGFIKGVDRVGFERDTKRIELYKKKAELLYDKRRKFIKELPKNKTLNEKRIRNLNIRVDEYIDLMFFYEVRVKQFNIKYKQNE